MLTIVTTALLATSCAHAGTKSCAHDATAQPAEAESGETVEAVDESLAKFDPALRWKLRDKLATEIGAVVLLSKELPAAAVADLQANGLRILHAEPKRLHVEGDAQALLRLAAHAEVTRLGASGPMKPAR